MKEYCAVVAYVYARDGLIDTTEGGKFVFRFRERIRCYLILNRTTRTFQAQSVQKAYTCVYCLDFEYK